MSKSAEKSELHEVEEILSSKAKAAALDEREQQIVHRALGAALNTEIKESIDLFARRVVGPRLRLMKALKAGGGKGLPLKRPRRGQVRQAEPPPSLSRAGTGQPISGGALSLMGGAPGPSWPMGTGAGLEPLPPPFYAKYPPPYFYGFPSSEFDRPTDPPNWLPSSMSQVVLGDRFTGNLSLAGVVGSGLGLPKGPDTWFFGDETIAQAGILQPVTIPAWGFTRSAGITVDVTVPPGTNPFGGPSGTDLYVQSESGWVGILGYISLGLSLGNRVSQMFLNTWAANDPTLPDPKEPVNQLTQTPFWMPGQFQVSGTFSVPAQATLLIVQVAAWVAALRVTAVDGYEQDAAGFEFLDGAKVNHSTATIYTSPDPGPINISDITVWVV